jgi:hypothetical protein
VSKCLLIDPGPNMFGLAPASSERQLLDGFGEVVWSEVRRRGRFYAWHEASVGARGRTPTTAMSCGRR